VPVEWTPVTWPCLGSWLSRPRSDSVICAHSGLIQA